MAAVAEKPEANETARRQIPKAKEASGERLKFMMRLGLGYYLGAVQILNRLPIAGSGLVETGSRTLQKTSPGRGVPEHNRPHRPGRLLRLVAKRAFEAFAGGGGKGLRSGVGHLLRVLLDGFAQEPDLFTVTPAPFAKEHMKTEPEPFGTGQGAIQRLRLEAADIAARGQEGAKPCLERGRQVLHELHVKVALSRRKPF